VKVKILSGNQAGTVVDLERLEAEAAISTGYAELYTEPKAEPEPKEPKETAKPAAKKGKGK
jgi:hypothetical protein